ncbi:MAG: hypothetical protein IAE79_07155, partial [Anaerolinea sp.]|nr:hypothetical protein [Anaerolinea sp.]
MNTQKLYQFDQARDSIQFRISGRGVLLLLAAFLVFCTPSFAQARSLSNNSHTSNVSIAYDETQSGAIVSPVGTVGYSFQGQVGENILVRVMVTSGNLDPEFRLFRPDGTLLCDGRTLGAFVEKTCIINATGPHEILISAWGGNTTGNFDLYLQRTSNPVGQINLPFDETQSAAITPSIDLNAHTFTAVPQTPPPPSTSLPIKAYLPIITGGGSNAFSDSVLVRMKATSGSLDPQFRVFRPDGSLLCAGQTLGSFVETLCLVDRSGDHAILAGAWNANATGNYDLYIQSTAYPANATPIAYDETQSASVSLPVDLNAYTFEGTAGDQVLVRMRAT